MHTPLLTDTANLKKPKTFDQQSHKKGSPSHPMLADMVKLSIGMIYRTKLFLTENITLPPPFSRHGQLIKFTNPI